MISQTVKQEILLRHRDGIKNRQIAAQLGIDKNTVNRYVNEYESKLRELLEQSPDQNPESLMEALMQAPSYNAGSRRPTVATEEIIREIQSCLKENERKVRSGMAKQQMRAADIHRYLIEEKGYRISYSTVRKLVHEMKARTKEHGQKQDTCAAGWK